MQLESRFDTFEFWYTRFILGPAGRAHQTAHRQRSWYQFRVVTSQHLLARRPCQQCISGAGLFACSAQHRAEWQRRGPASPTTRPSSQPWRSEAATHRLQQPPLQQLPMGRPFVELLESECGILYSCAACRTPLARKEGLLSKVGLLASMAHVTAS